MFILWKMEGDIISFRKKKITFIRDKRAVIGMPLRLTVCLIIGSFALMLILIYILNPCIIPGKLVVRIEPIINIIPSGSNQETFRINVTVEDKEGYSITDADVLIKGLGDAESNLTDKNGITTIEITPHLKSGVNEGYLDITVKAPCKETFSQNKMIKVVRES